MDAFWALCMQIDIYDDPDGRIVGFDSEGAEEGGLRGGFFHLSIDHRLFEVLQYVRSLCFSPLKASPLFTFSRADDVTTQANSKSGWSASVLPHIMDIGITTSASSTLSFRDHKYFTQ